MRTRVKICGVTSVEDGLTAARHGADAIGLVFHRPSPRYVTLERAGEIAASLPPFVARVAVLVNPSIDDLNEIIHACQPDLLQFHGEESPSFCRGFGIPYLRALRMKPSIDLLESLSPYDDAAGWLLDAYRADLYGGAGETFDWGLIPQAIPRPVIISGGLNAGNVGEAIRRLRPWAVDVSSGVESAKGVKAARLIAAFIAGVRDADVRPAG
jgi:phosphoribosylanthranilate isomerase